MQKPALTRAIHALPISLGVTVLPGRHHRTYTAAQFRRRYPMAAMQRIRRDHAPQVAPVRRRELVAWAFYDFANSGYTTVVITAVFNAYFVGVIAAKAPWATLAWTLALSVSYAVIMASAPVLGAIADLRARKKTVL